MTGTEASGVRARGRAAIAARTLRTDRWWAYPLTTFSVLLAFVGYATYAAVANRDYYAAPYLSPFYSPCLSYHCGTVAGSAGAPHLGWLGTCWIVPLDARDRRAVLREEQGLGLCNITKCCTEVCPAGIKITDNAIIPMKERSADQRYDPLGRVLRTWRRRADHPPAG